MNEPTPTTPPGSPEALRQGCDCSVLLQPDQPGADPAFVNPLCPLHGGQPGDRADTA
ncbi:hypothetical protein [Actinomycetospora termitidis]|uniref:Uncharacterized protein n=1 Tax=Actinomycetospora termitidis TaxID=3053470 RepID=A0ABT7MG09_9PSEU|nr:hypothetical protein [Actinomycetospora sp. Odt1-22]MDL5159610.1 hypothetical protein [Actinomycetospora sp. Odt1-22]